MSEEEPKKAEGDADIKLTLEQLIDIMAEHAHMAQGMVKSGEAEATQIWRGGKPVGVEVRDIKSGKIIFYNDWRGDVGLGKPRFA